MENPEIAHGMGHTHFHNSGPAPDLVRQVPTPSRSQSPGNTNAVTANNQHLNGVTNGMLAMAPSAGTSSMGPPAVPLKALQKQSSNMDSPPPNAVKLPGKIGWWIEQRTGCYEPWQPPCSANGLSSLSPSASSGPTTSAGPQGNVTEKHFPETYSEADKIAATFLSSTSTDGRAIAGVGNMQGQASEASLRSEIPGTGMTMQSGNAGLISEPEVLNGVSVKRPLAQEASPQGACDGNECPAAERLASSPQGPEGAFHGAYPGVAQPQLQPCWLPPGVQRPSISEANGDIRGPLPGTVSADELAFQKLLEIPPPKWAMAALTLNTGYEEIVRILDDGTKRLLHMEHPEMIQALCRGLAALPESWNNPSQVMYKLIRTAQKVQRYDNYMYVQQWVPIIPMVLILCCSGLNGGSSVCA